MLSAEPGSSGIAIVSEAAVTGPRVAAGSVAVGLPAAPSLAVPPEAGASEGVELPHAATSRSVATSDAWRRVALPGPRAINWVLATASSGPWSDRLVGQPDVMAGVTLEVLGLALGEPLADPAPVERHRVARDELGDEPAAVRQPRRVHELGGGEPQLAPVQDQRAPLHAHSRTVDRGDFAPADPAVIEGRDHVPVQLADPQPYVEHVEAVVRQGAGRHLVGDEVHDLGRQLPAEPLAQRRVQLVGGELAEQVVADPVGLDHPLVEQILRPRAGRDGA